MEKLITACLNKNGYLELSKLKGRAVISKKNYKGNVSIETEGDKYYFKPSATSGGVRFADKEIYESFISKLIRGIVPSVEYFPATLDGAKGVVSKHWDTMGDGYLPLNKALPLKKRKDCLYVDSVEEFETIYTGDFCGGEDQALKKQCSKDCLETILKAPILLAGGDYDFKLSNVAVQCLPRQKLKNMLSFDYGFNLYNLVDNYLKWTGLIISKENIEIAINSVIENWYDIPLAFGATKNCTNYDDLNSLLYDFYCYSHRNSKFKKNIEIATTLSNFVDETLKEMRYYNIPVGKYKECLIKNIINYWQKEYTNILNK